MNIIDKQDNGYESHLIILKALENNTTINSLHLCILLPYLIASVKMGNVIFRILAKVIESKSVLMNLNIGKFDDYYRL